MQPRFDAVGGVRAASWLVGVYSLFVVVAAILGSIAGAPEPWERDLIQEVADARTDALGRFMVAITHLGDGITVTVILAALAAGAAWRKMRGWVRFFSIALIGAIGIHPVVKVLIERARPAESFIDAGGFAFPSGHAAASAGLAAALIVFFVDRVAGRTRAWVVLAAVAYAGAVGVSRVVLGVHWPTDVVAGWTLGATWVLVVARVVPLDGKS